MQRTCRGNKPPSFFRSTLISSLLNGAILLLGAGGCLQLLAQTASPAQRPAASSAVTAAPPALVNRAVNPHGPAAYVIGIGDLIRVDVFGESQFDGSAVIRPDGKVSLPLVSDVVVAGLTPVAAEQLLASRLSKFVQYPKVTITVIEIHSRVVYITGEVFRPGAYTLNDSINVVQLVSRAGGPTGNARKKRVYVLRGGSGERVNVDYRKVLLGQHVEENVSLNPGDTVVVP